MRNRLQLRKNWSWLIALAIVVTALGPMLHQGSRSASPAGFVVTAICTTGGLKWFNTKSGQIEDRDSAPGQHATGKSCDCCTGASPALVSAPASSITQLERGPVLRPAHASHFPQQRAGWLQSSPRAPPQSA